MAMSFIRKSVREHKQLRFLEAKRTQLRWFTTFQNDLTSTFNSLKWYLFLFLSWIRKLWEFRISSSPSSSSPWKTFAKYIPMMNLLLKPFKYIDDAIKGVLICCSDSQTYTECSHMLEKWSSRFHSILLLY